MNELDEILLDQLTVARHLAKKMRKARKVMGPDPSLIAFQDGNEKRIQFFESMINDKTLLHKKHKRKKRTKSIDILARNPVIEWYKIAFMATTFSYKMFTDSVSQYMSYFTKKGKQ